MVQTMAENYGIVLTQETHDDGICKLISDKIKEGKTRYLSTVIMDDCPKVTDEGKRCIKLATMKAQSNKGNEYLNHIVKTAETRDKMHSEGKFQDTFNKSRAESSKKSQSRSMSQYPEEEDEEEEGDEEESDN